jgi:hypothetical protein
MAFRTLNQCTDCEAIVDDWMNHDCPKDPMKDPVKKAEYEAWDAEYQRRSAIWDEYLAEHGATRVAYPSMDCDPTDLAIQGKCVFIGYGDSGLPQDDFVSGILENPSWGDLLYLFDACVAVTGDTHHSFLEGMAQVREVPDWVSERMVLNNGRLHGQPNTGPAIRLPDPDVKVFEFLTGS